MPPKRIIRIETGAEDNGDDDTNNIVLVSNINNSNGNASGDVGDGVVLAEAVPCLVCPESNLLYASEVHFTRSAGIVCVVWTNCIEADGTRGTSPAEMIVPLNFLLSADPGDAGRFSNVLIFEEGFSLQLVFASQGSQRAFETSLANNMEEVGELGEAALLLERMSFRLVLAKERALTRVREAYGRESLIKLDRRLWRQRVDVLSSAFDKWVAAAAVRTAELMDRDKNRWCMHAKASEDLDLQAWYHDSFNEEIFHLKVKFWMRDSVLPSYKLSNKLIANKLTKYEEAALAHVLCTPDTTYGDVASHMFVIQSMVTPSLYSLFEDICSKGISVVKYPRSGAPAKKLFRFSFVEGSVYFTWKGQYGNQGVDLAEVNAVEAGLCTDILRKAGRRDKEHLYVSLVCAERSVDLQCATREERDGLQGVLAALVAKEKDSAALVTRGNSEKN